MLVSAATHVGRVRQVNEDRYCVWAIPGLDGHFFLAVADGMGGHQAGEVASSMAVDLVRRYLEEGFGGGDMAASGSLATSAGDLLCEAIRLANISIYKAAQESPEMAGMGTTITAAVAGPGLLCVAHVGDSRAYLVSGGEVSLLTEDHSLVGQMLKNGNLTREEAVLHPKRHVLTRALGVEEDLTVDILHRCVKAGDFLVLATDGLTNLVTPEEMVEILSAPPSGFETVADYLVELANERGGFDNATVIVARI